MFSIIDNDSMKSIIKEFVKELNDICNIFLYIIITGTILIFILIFIKLILFIHSISNIIYDFTSKIYFFLRKTSNNTNKDETFKIFDENSFKDEENDVKKYPLLIGDNSDEKNDDENELIKDLYQIYFKFYRLKDKDLIKIFEEGETKKNSGKINQLRQSNELFKLFLEFSLNISKFKFHINIDYDFYKDSKLMKNFLKEFSNKSLTNEDKEQI